MIKVKHLVCICLLIPVIGLSQQNEEAIIQKLANQGDLKMEVERDTVPIKIWNDEILLKVKVNENEGYFLWDNGFSFTAVDESYGSQLHLKEIDNLNNVEAIDGVRACLKILLPANLPIDYLGLKTMASNFNRPRIPICA